MPLLLRAAELVNGARVSYRMTPFAGSSLGTEGEIMSDRSNTLSHRKRKLSAIPKLVPPSSWDPVCPNPAIRLH